MSFIQRETEDYIYNLFTFQEGNVGHNISFLQENGFTVEKKERIRKRISWSEVMYREVWTIRKNGQFICSFVFYAYDESSEFDVVQIYRKNNELESDEQVYQNITSTMIEHLNDSELILDPIINYIIRQDQQTYNLHYL